MRQPTHVGCLAEGCDRKHFARGYCSPHYKRMQRTGQLKASRQPLDAQARLDDLRFMAETGECLNGAAKRLGVSTRVVEIFLTRHDERDLLRTLTRRNPRDFNDKRNLEAVV